MVVDNHFETFHLTQQRAFRMSQFQGKIFQPINMSTNLRPLNPNPHIPHEQNCSASACIRVPHHPSRTTPQHQHTSNQVRVNSYVRHQNILRTHYQNIQTRNPLTKHSPLNKDANAEYLYTFRAVYPHTVASS